MKNKHKHAEMIKAKADNMDLVVFYRLEGEYWWQKESDDAALPYETDIDYFLCLPKHEEACLHWLNTGEIQGLVCGKWTDLHQEDMDMSLSLSFRCKFNKYRIKPRKEKRWIAVHLYSNQATPAVGTYKLCSDYVLRHMKLLGSPFCEWQFIEIEVEV